MSGSLICSSQAGRLRTVCMAIGLQDGRISTVTPAPVRLSRPRGCSAPPSWPEPETDLHKASSTEIRGSAGTPAAVPPESATPPAGCPASLQAQPMPSVTGRCPRLMPQALRTEDAVIPMRMSGHCIRQAEGQCMAGTQCLSESHVPAHIQIREWPPARPVS